MRKPLTIASLLLVFAAAGATILAVRAPAHEPIGERYQEISKLALASQLAATQSFNLSNGLQVVVVPDDSVQRVAHMVWYRAGAIDDPPGKSGLAHFVEHLTFGGTRSFSRQAFSSSLEAISPDEGALTTRDYTVFYQIVLSKDLSRAMQLESERMRSVVFSKRSMTEERKEVAEERRDSKTDAESELLDRLTSALYRGSASERPVLGRPGDVASITRQDAAAFYQSMYTPSNAIVVVHGPVTTDSVRRLAEQYYGSLPSGTPSPRPTIISLAPAEASSFVVRDRGRVWLRLYLASATAETSLPRVEAFDVLRQILERERLHHALVVNNPLAAKVSVEYGADAGPHSLTIRVTARQGANAQEIGRVVDTELQSLLQRGPTDSEVDRARDEARIDERQFEESLPLVPQFVGRALVRGHKLEDVKDWARRIASVTRNEVHAALKSLLASPRTATGFLVSS